MSHEYLLDLYSLLNKRIDETRKDIESSPENSANHSFHSGRLLTQIDILQFLKENYHNKLPRAVRKTLGE